MPIIVDINANDGGFMGLTNEAVWANSFSDELGVLDNNALLSFQNFNIDGFVMKKSTFVKPVMVVPLGISETMSV